MAGLVPAIPIIGHCAIPIETAGTPGDDAMSGPASREGVVRYARGSYLNGREPAIDVMGQNQNLVPLERALAL